MKSGAYLAALPVLLLCAALAWGAQPQDAPAAPQVEVFVWREDVPRLLRGEEEHLRVYVLQRGALGKSLLLRKGKASPEQLRRWLQGPAGRRALERVQRRYQGWEKLGRYRLEGLPAVVFDGGAGVVYGVLDIPRARALYESRRR